MAQNDRWHSLIDFTISGKLACQPQAIHEQVAGKLAGSTGALNLTSALCERLTSTITEALLTMIRLDNDHVTSPSIRIAIYVASDAGLSTLGLLLGWGFFLIEKMGESLDLPNSQTQHQIEVYLYQEGGNC
ncbi:hypothetical protein BH10CHL1_BH10CHL1_14580 [soil metagenome]